jgi:hypothetical protein
LSGAKVKVRRAKAKEILSREKNQAFTPKMHGTG